MFLFQLSWISEIAFACYHGESAKNGRVKGMYTGWVKRSDGERRTFIRSLHVLQKQTRHKAVQSDFVNAQYIYH